MTNPYRAMCAELLADYEQCRYRLELHDRARALLAQPVVEGPTDEELLAMRSWSCHGPTFDSDLVDYARAVLAKWGHQ